MLVAANLQLAYSLPRATFSATKLKVMPWESKDVSGVKGSSYLLKKKLCHHNLDMAVFYMNHSDFELADILNATEAETKRQKLQNAEQDGY